MTALPKHVFEPTRYSLADLTALRQSLNGLPAEEVIRWALTTFGPRLMVASSFSPEDIVLMHLAATLDPNVRVFTLDTGRLHQETYAVLEAVRVRLGISIEVMFPDQAAVEGLVRAKGPNSFYESVADRKECCAIRKVEPLRRALSTADAWATGMRREQSITRHELHVVELDLLNGGILKLNPLADWSSEQIWDHIRAHELPYNELHDRGFPSIGCAPCTRAVKPGEDDRAGRWWWERPDDKECGLHR